MAEEDPWAFDEGEGSKAGTPSKGSKPASKTGSKAASPSVHGSKAATPQPGAATPSGEPQEEAEAPRPPPPEDDGYRKPVQLYRHWVRPKFLQYKYMYNYRTNYYDDVIDYLDKRQMGIKRAIPQAQTWAERVLRTNAASGRVIEPYHYQQKEESNMIVSLPASIRPYNYHTRAYIHQRYASVL